MTNRREADGPFVDQLYGLTGVDTEAVRTVSLTVLEVLDKLVDRPELVNKYGIGKVAQAVIIGLNDVNLTFDEVKAYLSGQGDEVVEENDEFGILYGPGGVDVFTSRKVTRALQIMLSEISCSAELHYFSFNELAHAVVDGLHRIEIDEQYIARYLQGNLG